MSSGRPWKGALHRFPEPPEQSDILDWRLAPGTTCGLHFGQRRHDGEPSEGVDAVEMKPSVLICRFDVHGIRHLAPRYGFHSGRE